MGCLDPTDDVKDISVDPACAVTAFRDRSWLGKAGRHFTAPGTLLACDDLGRLGASVSLGYFEDFTTPRGRHPGILRVPRGNLRVKSRLGFSACHWDSNVTAGRYQ